MGIQLIIAEINNKIGKILSPYGRHVEESIEKPCFKHFKVSHTAPCLIKTCHTHCVCRYLRASVHTCNDMQLVLIMMSLSFSKEGQMCIAPVCTCTRMSSAHCWICWTLQSELDGQSILCHSESSFQTSSPKQRRSHNDCHNEALFHVVTQTQTSDNLSRCSVGDCCKNWRHLWKGGLLRVRHTRGRSLLHGCLNQGTIRDWTPGERRCGWLGLDE